MRALLFLALLFALWRPALAADIELGFARETVAISSSFSGTEVVLFGSIEGGDAAALKAGDYDIVVTLVGPIERVKVRRKERRLGVWINGPAARFREVPSSYTFASTAPLNEVAEPQLLASLGLGIDNIEPRRSGKPVGDETDIANYATSLRRLKRQSALYSERPGAVNLLSPTLFRARLPIPANVPIGRHRAHAYLFRNGEFEMTRSILLDVRKTGLESWIYNLAHRQGLLYGILGVLIAMATGWLAAVIFGKD